MVTAFWSPEGDGGTGADKPGDVSYEKTCARNVFAECIVAGVKHLVYSALEDTSKVQEFNADGALKPFEGGEYVVPHFDGKGQIMAELNEQTELAVDFVMMPFYYGGCQCAFYYSRIS